jgi:hypothetical protein
LQGIAAGKGIAARPSVGVDAEIGSILPSQIVQAEKQDAVFENVCDVPRMKGMAITEHPRMIP